MKKSVDPAVEAVGRVLKKRLRMPEREFFYEHLVEGGPADTTDGRQRQLASLLEETVDEKSIYWSPATVADLAKRADGRGESWGPLAFYLNRIRITESVLASSSILFDFLLGSDGQTVKSVANAIEQQWGGGIASIDKNSLADLHSEWSGDEASTGDRWVTIGKALSQGSYLDVIEHLVEQNASVMAARGGAAWVEKSRGKLSVRFVDENGRLPSQDELSQLWRFPYFLDSLRSVATSLREKPSA